MHEHTAWTRHTPPRWVDDKNHCARTHCFERHCLAEEADFTFTALEDYKAAKKNYQAGKQRNYYLNNNTSLTAYTYRATIRPVTRIIVIVINIYYARTHYFKQKTNYHVMGEWLSTSKQIEYYRARTHCLIRENKLPSPRDYTQINQQASKDSAVRGRTA